MSTSPGILFGLHFSKSRACHDSLFEFICVSPLLCLEDTVSLGSFITYSSYNLFSSSAQVSEP